MIIFRFENDLILYWEKTVCHYFFLIYIKTFLKVNIVKENKTVISNGKFIFWLYVCWVGKESKIIMRLRDVVVPRKEIVGNQKGNWPDRCTIQVCCTFWNKFFFSFNYFFSDFFLGHKYATMSLCYHMYSFQFCFKLCFLFFFFCFSCLHLTNLKRTKRNILKFFSRNF